MGRLSAKSKAKALEAFLTAQNENAKALADIASGISVLRFRELTSLYADKIAEIVNALEVSGNRIVDGPKSRAALKELASLNRNYVAAAVNVSGPAREITAATEAVVANATKAMKQLAATKADDIAIAAFEKDIAAYAGRKVYRSYGRLAAEIATSTHNILNDAIAQYSGNKQDLIETLFSSKGLDAFAKENEIMRNRAEAMTGKVLEALQSAKDAAEKGLPADIIGIRDTFKSELDKYYEDRRAFLEGDQSLFGQTGLERRATNDVKKAILDAHQDNINQIAAKTYGRPLFVNAKNTGHDDNCVQAMDSEPMTEDEWQQSDFGLPRSPKRDCTVYCECILYPVGDENEPDEVTIADGREVSSAEARAL